MDHRIALVLAWLEGEGERRRHRFPLPPRVGDPAVRGWAHVGVCVLAGTLAAGLFVCWLARAWHVAGIPSRRSFAVGGAMTLEGARVEAIARDVKAGRPAPLTLIVRHGGWLMACEFRK